MQFKKEFDIDKDFFLEKPIRPKKRKVAIKVFLVVMFLTFVALCVSAFSFNFNTRFGKKILAIAPKNLKDAQQLYFDAIRYYDEGNNEKAIEYLNKQLSIVDDPDAYIYLAKIYLEEGNQTLAIANFETAIEFNPDSYEANYELGKIYFSLNDYKNASKYLTQASKSQIDNLEVLSLTAQAYKLRGMADDAIVLLKKYLKASPKMCLQTLKSVKFIFRKWNIKRPFHILKIRFYTLLTKILP